MVNITPATVTPGSLQIAVDAADVDVVLAATRSLAGFGAGAFTRGGGQTGSAQAYRRQPDRAGSGFRTGSGFGAHQSSPVTKSSPVSTQQNNQMTRINPATPGGLGPHPVREPVPV